MCIACEVCGYFVGVNMSGLYREWQHVDLSATLLVDMGWLQLCPSGGRALQEQCICFASSAMRSAALVLVLLVLLAGMQKEASVCPDCGEDQSFGSCLSV